MCGNAKFVMPFGLRGMKGQRLEIQIDRFAESACFDCAISRHGKRNRVGERN
jgi:hypothetical protein